MAPSKTSHNKNVDINPYSWCINKKSEEISIQELYTVYRINNQTCDSCTRTCKKNPRCLWGFGEKKWIKKEEVESDEEDEQLNRNEGQLVGIVNLGATCYVNSLLQLWFHNPILRPAILKWKPNNIALTPTQNGVLVPDSEDAYKPTCPISHLQAMFARMLLSKRSTIDPTEFITSLSLNTGEQQDAQEFSNLLMTLLDVLLEKHQSKEIQNLIKDSFTGTYQYETICETCQRTSVRSCDFRELELMVKRDLKDSILEFLKEERLTDGNKYNCDVCGPTSARRRIKIVKLPPVLNLQLMRFMYDRESQQKKKNKLQITFPETLDTTSFVETDHPNGNQSDDTHSNIYILNAVLNHKGKNAHHGHYIAHIKDMSTGNWFECNDDNVQRVKSSSKTLIIKNDEANNNTTTGDVSKAKATEYTSDGAYMLVYTRKSYMDPSNHIEIHDYLKKMVIEEDKGFEEEYMKNKAIKDNEIKRKELRQDEINLLYRDLLPKKVETQILKNSSSAEPTSKPTTRKSSLTVNQNAVSTSTAKNNASVNFDFIASTFLPDLFDLKIDPKLYNNSIVCRHGKLKPPGLNDITVPYRIIPSHFSDVLFGRYEYDLRLLGNSALCRDCVKENCKRVNDLVNLEKDYKTFIDLTKKPNESDPVWISNDLMRNWRRQAKYNIEAEGNDELNGYAAYTEIPLNSELRCNHGSLDPSASKTTISLDAWNIVANYFTNIIVYPKTESVCEACVKISQTNSLVQQENKTIAALQKTNLADLYSNRNRPDVQESIGVFYLIPTNFVNEWKRFIRDPTKTNVPVPRMESLTCQHELFMYPIHTMNNLTQNEPSGFPNSVTLVTEGEWNFLKAELGVCTEFKIVLRAGASIEYETDVCNECSVEFWSNEAQKMYTYEEGNMFIEKKDDISNISQPQCSQDDYEDDVIQVNGQEKRRKQEPIRRSKRTRITRNIKKYTNIDSKLTIKDFQKIYLYKDYSAILSDQHLFHNGKELTEAEKKKTFGELQIPSNSNLVLIIDPPASESDIKAMEVNTIEPSQPETGFRGTILQGGA